MTIIKFLITYFVIINIFSSLISVVDKHNAKHNKRRISEDFLMTIGLVGGALFELIILKTIHHKTKHRKFMVGLPIEIAFHIAILTFIILYV